LTQGTERECVFIGGPYDGWSGPFWDTGQKSVPYGEPGFENDIYERVGNTRDNKVKFKWNQTLSRAMWNEWAKEKGIPPEMLQSKRQIKPAADGTLQEVEEAPRVRVEVKHNPESHEWELYLLGKVEATISEKEIGTPASMKPEILQDWIRSMGIAR
jgi:hypothetical protein